MKYEADTTKPFSPPPPQRNNGTMGVAVQSVSKSIRKKNEKNAISIF
jgi:hypothetical protein